MPASPSQAPHFVLQAPGVMQILYCIHPWPLSSKYTHTHTHTLQAQVFDFVHASSLYGMLLPLPIPRPCLPGYYNSCYSLSLSLRASPPGRPPDCLVPSSPPLQASTSIFYSGLQSSFHFAFSLFVSSFLFFKL